MGGRGAGVSTGLGNIPKKTVFYCFPMLVLERLYACMVIPIKSYNSNAQHSIFTIARNTTVQLNCIAYNSVCRSACKVIPLKNSNNDLNPAAPHRWPQIHQQQQWQAYILWSRQVSTHCNNRHKKCWQFWIEIWPFASSYVSEKRGSSFVFMKHTCSAQKGSIKWQSRYIKAMNPQILCLSKS